MIEREFDGRGAARKVLDVDRDVIYSSVSEAGRKTGIPLGTLYYAMKREKSCKGRNFRFLTGGEERILDDAHYKFTLYPNKAIRKCLRCERKFFSLSPAHRVCPVCKKSEEWKEGHE